MQLYVRRNTRNPLGNDCGGIKSPDIIFIESGKTVDRVTDVRCLVSHQSIFDDLREFDDFDAFLVAFPQAVEIIVKFLYPINIVRIERIENGNRFIVVVERVGGFVHRADKGNAIAVGIVNYAFLLVVHSTAVIKSKCDLYLQKAI